MGFMDLFRRKPVETRSSGTGYTAQIIAARSSFLTGSAGLGELTAAVQSCVMLWEGGLALADVRVDPARPGYHRPLSGAAGRGGVPDPRPAYTGDRLGSDHG